MTNIKKGPYPTMVSESFGQTFCKPSSKLCLKGHAGKHAFLANPQFVASSNNFSMLSWLAIARVGTDIDTPDHAIGDCERIQNCLLTILALLHDGQSPAMKEITDSQVASSKCLLKALDS
eukprot:CAMPEP_0169262832 /NCGR_PEP_ID=MMETSP1016-20121227/43974_1 /TAXON_ID=342587 /ORGANISM="Karlodinium micrum, Strain CCMP2283" /LENGTH=119 /DNA_ID=CAMNT_0009345497 /DNA_START=260 /DNA_END=619 /DNA_ORIENTATION=-